MTSLTGLDQPPPPLPARDRPSGSAHRQINVSRTGNTIPNHSRQPMVSAQATPTCLSSSSDKPPALPARKTFETKSFIQRHTAVVYSDPDNLSVPVNENAGHAGRAATLGRSYSADPAPSLPQPQLPGRQDRPSLVANRHFEPPAPLASRQRVATETTTPAPPSIPSPGGESNGQTRSKITEGPDLEMMYRFHSISDLPPPEKFTNRRAQLAKRAAERRAKNPGYL